MKKILVLILGMLCLFGCTKEFEPQENNFNFSGTEWVNKTNDGSVGLKFYNNYQVTFFIASGANVLTTNGSYEYISSVKSLSFTGLKFYDKNTYKTIIELKGGEMIDKKTMKVSIWFDGETDEGYLYKQ